MPRVVVCAAGSSGSSSIGSLHATGSISQGRRRHKEGIGKRNPWLANAPVTELPGTSWLNSEQVKQQYEVCIAALLTGFENADTNEGALAAAATAVKLHHKYGTAADIVLMVYGAELPAWQKKYLTDELHVRLLHIDMDVLWHAAPTPMRGSKMKKLIEGSLS